MIEIDAMDLNPIGKPPSRFAKWCPSCQRWFASIAGCAPIRFRCPLCRTALVRQTKPENPKPGELRPGIIAEFADPRDRYDPSREIAALRERLRVRVHEELGV